MFKFARRVVERAIIQADTRAQRALRSLNNINSGQSVFLVGSAPSLKLLPYEQLPIQNVSYMVVNNGVRLFKDWIIPFHVVSDIDCFRDYSADWSDLKIRTAFYRKRFYSVTPQEEDLPYDIHWVPYRNGGILKRGFQPQMNLGIGNDSSVISFAVQICYFLGFQNVFIIGCDLDINYNYSYAYEMSDTDRQHESLPETQAKRASLPRTNDEFRVIRAQFEAVGRGIFNCGVGGNLTSIPRMDFSRALSISLQTAQPRRELSGGRPFGADSRDWSYHTSVFQYRDE